MAELVDALASGASVRKDVEVRVLFWAPKARKYTIYLKYLAGMQEYASTLESTHCNDLIQT